MSLKKYIPFTITIDSSILQLLESIANKQGKLTAYKYSIQDQLQIETIANIDAVHFSTKIEGNHLTRDQVTQALQKKIANPINHDLREVMNYSRTRKLARQWVLKNKPMNEEWILSHHKELMKGIVKGKLSGYFRNSQCAIQDAKSGELIYMAADAKDIPMLMKGLLAWLRKQRTLRSNYLLVAAQFHFEFVTIHPFMDGNGRLARLLTNSILLAGGYDLERFSALEKQHEKNRGAYYHALRSLQAHNYYDIPQVQDIRSWVLYWLQCLDSAYEEALSRVSKTIISNFSSQPAILENRFKKAESLFRKHHKLKASEYADLMGLARTQAVADLNCMVDLKIIERVGGGRSTLYKIKK